ncbi:MAG TPA: HAD-IA family hydrolase [Methylophilaceae bacterium]
MQLVLFDLDGTLADTAPDLGHALNLQREKHGLAALSQEIIRPYASHGTPGLLKIGFGLTRDDADFEPMRAEYLALYDQVFCRQPTLFAGMAELLQQLEVRRFKWGVVTNKPRRFTGPLMQALGLSTRASCIVSGDDCERPKPHPDTLLMAAKQAQTEPQHCIYVGDAERDIIAARAAGMASVVALYGYLGENDKPNEWGAQHMIMQPSELFAWL